jgi:phage FluMu protein Com
MFVATCPFCQTINQFYPKYHSCNHYKKTEHEIKGNRVEYYAIFVEDYFLEGTKEIKVLVEEESDEDN